MFNVELLNWLSNFVNALIFAYLFINIVNTKCFSPSQMSLSLVGLLSSIFVQIIAMTLNNVKGEK